MSSRRKSGRASGKVSYAETVAQLDNGDEEEVDLDEETAAAKKKRINQELAKERQTARKRESDDVDYGKAPKKAKNAKSKKKAFKDAGKLSEITNLPSDILAMIFSSLDPLDLLSLSRTNKMLHNFLRTETSIWVQCRKNLVIWIPKATAPVAYDSDAEDEEEDAVEQYEPLYVPAKPANLSEAAYIRLLFAKECFSCGNTKKRFVEDFALQTRLCRGCWNKELKNRGQLTLALEEEVGKKKVELAVFDIIPSFGISYHLDVVKAAHGHLLRKKKELKNKEYEEYIQTKKAEITARDGKAEEIESYIAAFARYGKDEVRRKWRERWQRISRRKAAIFERAMSEQWGDEDHLRAYLRHGGRKLLDKPQDFSEAEWQTLQVPLQAEMAARREFAATLAEHRKRDNLQTWLYTEYLIRIESKESSSRFKLSKGDLCSLPALQPIMDLSIPEGVDEVFNWDAQEAVDDYIALREELFQNAKGAVAYQAAQRQVEILSDLCAKVHAENQNSAAPLKVSDGIGNDTEQLLNKVQALETALNDIRAVFSCTTCSFENNPVALAPLDLAEHSHCVTTVECRNYDADRQPRRSHRSGDWGVVERPAPWQFEKVTINQELTFAVNMVLGRCAVFKQDLALESDRLVPDYTLPQTTSDKAKWEQGWRFVCNAAEDCNSRYRNRNGWSNGKILRKWDDMLAHLMEHYSSAQQSEEVLIKPSALEIVERPPPVPTPAGSSPTHLPWAIVSPETEMFDYY